MARLRKTIDRLSGLLDRIDPVLAQAVDEFPTIFDFSSTQADAHGLADLAAAPPHALYRNDGKGHFQDVTREAGLETSHGQGVAVADLDNDGDLDIYVTGAKPPGQAAGVPPYDENSLSRAADRVDWARRMHKKGYLTKNQLNQEVAQYQALKAQIDADIARAADRVDWAKRMFEKGYLSKAQYEAELLKHYAALKARLGGQTPATSNIEVLEALPEGAAIGPACPKCSQTVRNSQVPTGRSDRAQQACSQGGTSKSGHVEQTRAEGAAGRSNRAERSRSQGAAGRSNRAGQARAQRGTANPPDPGSG